MATFATGGFHGLRYVKETTFGETPVNPSMKNLRHTSCSLLLSKDSFQSQELRSDAQISDLRHGNRRAAGDIGLEFSFAEFDDFLAAAIRSAWKSDPDNVGNSFLVAGTDMSSFTIERVFTDIKQYQTFTGCEVGSLSLTIQTNAMVTGTMSIIGKNIDFKDTPLDADPDVSLSGAPFDGFKGALMEGGRQIAVITSVELSIANAIEPAFVIGSDTAESLVAGRINVTGTVSAYFENMDLLRKFVDEEESSLALTLGDGVSQSYVFTLPRIKYSGGDNPVEGEGPVTLNMPFQALYDSCTKTNMRIDKIPGAQAAPCALTYDSTSFTEDSTDTGKFLTPIKVTVAGGTGNKTFNGTIGQIVPGVTFTGTLPAGITAECRKVSNTECSLTLVGTASAVVTSGSFEVSFAASAFAFGFCHCPGSDITDKVKTITLIPA